MTAASYAPRRGAYLMQSATRGALLVGAAIAVGVLLLKVVSDAPGGASGGSAHVGGGTTPSTLVTTSTTLAGQAPQHVTVAVYNASGVPMAATTRANALRGLGYAITFTGNSPSLQTGTTVACRSTTKGFTTTADTIAKSIGPTTSVQVFPVTPPLTATSAQCIVTVGK